MTYVFLGVPNQGQIVASAMPGLTNPSAKYPVSCVYDAASSALCRNFNVLMTTARNQPERPAFFAMHHADVSTCPGWVDMLIEEMQRVGADVISAAIPIKDARGLSSSGVLSQDGTRLKRFTMRDVHSLPETFDAAGAGFPGHALLVNTGLWVGRTEAAWFEKTFFRFEDDVNSKGEPFLRSEDWLWSEDLHRYGTRVFCTRKVPVLHWGIAPFSNEKPWGGLKEDGWAEWRKPVVAPTCNVSEFVRFDEEPYPLGRP